jgi:hypothetical protein
MILKAYLTGTELMVEERREVIYYCRASRYQKPACFCKTIGIA